MAKLHDLKSQLTEEKETINLYNAKKASGANIPAYEQVYAENAIATAARLQTQIAEVEKVSGGTLQTGMARFLNGTAGAAAAAPKSDVPTMA